MTKIEIKEEDIGFACTIADEPRYGYELIINNLKTQKNCKQLKQQILQDHEDVKKWEENMILLSRNINDDLKQAKKDRQIVKRLEEIDYTDLFYAEKVQEILEGKK